MLQMRGIIQYFSFWGWLILLSLMSSGCIHVVACDRIPSFLRLNNSLYVYTTFFFNLFISWWASGLFLCLGYCGYCCYEHRCVCLYLKPHSWPIHSHEDLGLLAGWQNRADFPKSPRRSPLKRCRADERRRRTKPAPRSKGRSLWADPSGLGLLVSIARHCLKDTTSHVTVLQHCSYLNVSVITSQKWKTGSPLLRMWQVSWRQFPRGRIFVSKH